MRNLRFLWLVSSVTTALLATAAETYEVGLARTDITPDHPVRLSGYEGRRAEATGVTQRLWAKAIVLAEPGKAPFVLLVVDSIGVPAWITEKVARTLEKKAGVARERFALSSTHSHTAPCLTGVLKTLFGVPVPDDHQERIDLYTRTLVGKLERVCLEALSRRELCTLSLAQGQATFAGNRRTRGGPVDHTLPVLYVRSAAGKIRAIVANYASHCTSLGGDFNEVCGDWAGYAQELIEEAHPGALALITIGCGADSDPYPRTGLEYAKQHGREIAQEVERLLAGVERSLTGRLRGRFKRFDLHFEKHPTRTEWEKRAKRKDAIGYHARVQLERLDRGEKIEARLPYSVATWTFGKDLAMVFLPGEVVVDYSLRLGKDFDRSRLWVTAYANDVPCYIPSRRILTEGGYEAEGAMTYYDRPARLRPEVEETIIGAVHELLPDEYHSEEYRAENPPPLSPRASLESIRTEPEMVVELVAAEPLVLDPVAVDFGLDGRLWVVEMLDYPTGIDGRWTPGGRIKVLEDRDGDGRFDRGTVFLDELPFPTGVMAWRSGVLVCAAPDILFATDTDGDGVADTRRVLFTGFATDNYQARVNSLRYGLDNWVHGANGLLGGKIRSLETGRITDIGGRDFRMKPDEGLFESVAGLTQHGRVRDDWGNWFGNENWALLRHYPLAARYVRRNPHVPAPHPRVDVPADEHPNRLHPVSRVLERFNDPHMAQVTTSAYGSALYRDDLLGDEFQGNAFVCEPVHNLVRRLSLRKRGVSFAGYRQPAASESEFLASTDCWFRPVEARTGPDGALWIVDMYRFVIEHPRWIPPTRLALLDVRAGADRGRIYRVVPRDRRPRPIEQLKSLPVAELASRLDHPNGPLRDLIHRELVHRELVQRELVHSDLVQGGEETAVQELERIARRSQRAASRLQALCALDGLGSLSDGLLLEALADAHPEVRAHALRLAESHLVMTRGSSHPELTARIIDLVQDPEPRVRYQLALTLGEWDDPRAGRALGRIARANLGDPWLRAAVLSSATHHPDRIIAGLLAEGADTPEPIADTPERGGLIAALIATAAATEKRQTLRGVLMALTRQGNADLADGADGADGADPALWQYVSLASCLDALARARVGLADLAAADPESSRAVERARRIIARARELAVDSTLSRSRRIACVALLAREPEREVGDLEALASLLEPRVEPDIQDAAIAGLARSSRREAAHLLVRASRLSGPERRTAILETLLNREAWYPEVLDAIEAGILDVSQVVPAARTRIQENRNPRVRERAGRLFARVRPRNRADVLEAYRPALAMEGGVAAGGELFAKLCTSCHLFRGQGQAVGTDLEALRDKSPEYLLRAILDPNAALEEKFGTYVLATRDGRVLSGILTSETATTLILRQAGGLEQKVLRKDVLELAVTGRSFMPEGLEQGLESRDLADLFVYLRSAPSGE